MAMIDYRLITSADASAVQKEVKSLAASGFVPIGAPFCSPNGAFCQGMVIGDVAGGSAPTAGAVALTAIAGLDADNVQDAIAELHAAISA